MRRTLIAAWAVAALAAVAIGCGGDDDGDEGPLSKAELASEADAICTEASEQLALAPVQGPPSSRALEFAYSLPIADERNKALAALEPQPALKKDWQRFVDVNKKVTGALREALPAARKDDQETVDAILAKQGEAVDEREKLAKEFELEVCAQDPEPQIEQTGTGPPEDLEFPEPTNTLEQITDQFLSAANSGDCEAINEAVHSDNGTLPPPICKQIADSVKGAKVLGSEQYGPAGYVEFESADGRLVGEQFVRDIDGKLREGGAVFLEYSGLRPASEENDADETAQKLVTAIRENDPKAFADATSVVTEGGLAPKGKFTSFGGETGSGTSDELVADVRADPSAEPVQLGINQGGAFYLLQADGSNWVLTFIHEPGSETAYRFTGWFPIDAKTKKGG